MTQKRRSYRGWILIQGQYHYFETGCSTPRCGATDVNATRDTSRSRTVPEGGEVCPDCADTFREEVASESA